MPFEEGGANDNEHWFFSRGFFKEGWIRGFLLYKGEEGESAVEEVLRVSTARYELQQS